MSNYDINWDDVNKNSDPFSKNASKRQYKNYLQDGSLLISDEHNTVKKENESNLLINSVENLNDFPLPHIQDFNVPAEFINTDKVFDNLSTEATIFANYQNADQTINSNSERFEANGISSDPRICTNAEENVKNKEEQGLPVRKKDPRYPSRNVRRLSNSSTATFVLTPSHSPTVSDQDQLDGTEANVRASAENLANLKSERDHLQNVVEDMQRCIAEYELSLRQLAEGKARAEELAKESVIDIISERDQAVEEISTIEKAFGDLHRRFEKSKQIIESFKKNEEVLKRTAEEYQAQLRRQEEKYQALKAHAEKKLMRVAEETELIKRTSETELARMQVAIKRSELQIKGLEAQLGQKIRENTELTIICDELISKYGNKA